MHSGSAGAVVPSSFRILRLLLDRIEDPATGDLLAARAPRRPTRRAAAAAADAWPRPWTPPAPADHPSRWWADLALQGADAAEQALRAAWRASVAVVGADGLPPTAEAGAVLRPFTAVKLAIRLPPTADPEAAAAAVARALTSDPPYGASVTWEAEPPAGGWAARAAGAVAGRRPRPRLDVLLRPPLRPAGGGRDHPVHGLAGRAVPRRPSAGPRRARTRLQRPRARRGAPPAHRRAGHRLAGPAASTPTRRTAAAVAPRNRATGRPGRRPGRPGSGRTGRR